MWRSFFLQVLQVKLAKIMKCIPENEEETLDDAEICKYFVDSLRERIAKAKTQGIIAFVPNFKYCEIDDIFLTAERKGEKPFIDI